MLIQRDHVENADRRLCRSTEATENEDTEESWMLGFAIREMLCEHGSRLLLAILHRFQLKLALRHWCWRSTTMADR